MMQQLSYIKIYDLKPYSTKNIPLSHKRQYVPADLYDDYGIDGPVGKQTVAEAAKIKGSTLDLYKDPAYLDEENAAEGDR